ncbi:hypothetical protein DPMN_093818 [Dreissena polymorpha]|uniref:Uncharacterized protein n=1 Tax=Dreissena polymorpha TaxID=45954 RepID=A0A9D4R234_DREPO|nr:hypothetical protein DPMN_093818 [Dreissena polymorpha]
MTTNKRESRERSVSRDQRTVIKKSDRKERQVVLEDRSSDYQLGKGTSTKVAAEEERPKKLKRD